MAENTEEVREHKCCDCHSRWAYQVPHGTPKRNLVRCAPCARDLWTLELRRRKNLRVIH